MGDQKVLCGSCLKYVNSRLEERKENYNVKGEPIEISANVLVCGECGEDIFDTALDGVNIANAYAAYRNKFGLLSPVEIISIRKMYGLSQRAFARLLGWGEVTVHRYETGALQDDAHNSILVMLKDPSNMKLWIQKRKEFVNPKDYEKVLERTNNLLVERQNDRLKKIIVESFSYTKDLIDTGFRKFNYEKFMNMVLFFAANETLFKTKLMKLLWYADMLNFKRYTCSISGLKYVHLPYGPVPDQYDVLISILQGEKIVGLEPYPTEVCFGDIIVPKEIFQDYVLEHEELMVLQEVKDFFKNFSARDISEYSHKECGYLETVTGQTITYSYAKDLSI